MHSTEDFKSKITAGNTFKGDFITLGAAMLEGETLTKTFVNVPLKTMNRHGLIAGATVNESIDKPNSDQKRFGDAYQNDEVSKLH